MTSTVDIGAPRERMLHIVVNPASGNGAAGKSWHEFASELSLRGYSFEVRFTEQRGDAIRFAREYAARAVDTVVAMGGDGTVNEVINGLMNEQGPVTPGTRLAIASSGTGKDFVRSLGTRSIRQMLDALDTGYAEPIDLGLLTFIDGESGEQASRYFINVADMGLGADVARRIESSPSGKAFGGMVSYLVQAVKTIRVFKGKEINLSLDGEPVFEGSAQMVVFCNGAYFAGGMRIAPLSSLRDGLLDVVVLEEVSRRVLLSSLLPRVYLGRHLGRKGVHHFQAAEAVVDTPEPLSVELDGELPGVSPVTARVVPGTLNVVVLPPSE
ncbi:diacylglycerol kinase family lipid kinase [soil metagenome]